MTVVRAIMRPSSLTATVDLDAGIIDSELDKKSMLYVQVQQMTDDVIIGPIVDKHMVPHTELDRATGRRREVMACLTREAVASVIAQDISIEMAVSPDGELKVRPVLRDYEKALWPKDGLMQRVIMKSWLS